MYHLYETCIEAVLHNCKIMVMSRRAENGGVPVQVLGSFFIDNLPWNCRNMLNISCGI